MNDLPETTSNQLPTVEQQERIAAAIRAAGSVRLDALPIDEETARLIALHPSCRRDDPEAVMKAAFATKMRNSRIWSAHASGVALGPDGEPTMNQVASALRTFAATAAPGNPVRSADVVAALRAVGVPEAGVVAIEKNRWLSLAIRRLFEAAADEIDRAEKQS